MLLYGLTLRLVLVAHLGITSKVKEILRDFQGITPKELPNDLLTLQTI